LYIFAGNFLKTIYFIKHKTKSMRKILLLALLFLFTAAATFAQVTTSSMTGTIKDSKEALIGATVRAVHQPTGTSYSTSTNADGRFNIPNMRVGGPYQVTISYVGFQSTTLNDIYIRLGEPFVVNQSLAQNGVSLEAINVSGRKNQVLNSRRTGASTNINRTQLENLPTSNRSLQDFTRLTPQAGGSQQSSFGGASNRYNNITIDGAVNNDVFGLSASGTPGGQASTQPIALDAIQEIQVVLAPYDVTQGNFTGAGVNAVTRSGSNKFEGSIYYYNKNEDIQGKNVLTGLKSTNYSDLQYGVRVGGPIIKNKLFFFANVEQGRRTAPTVNNAGETGAAITLKGAQDIANYALSRYGYDVGSFNAINLKRENNKYFAKLDWNINDKHQLTARFNHINAFDDNLTRSASSFGFGNNLYKFNNKQSVGILELRSNFSNKYSNNLIVGYTRVRDARQTAGALFPQIQINNVDGVSGNSAFLGSERSSVANQLDQDIFEFTDNFKINLGDHNITIGTHNEFFKFRNLFINNLNGRWTMANPGEFLAVAPLNPIGTAQATYSKIPDDKAPAARFSAAQLGIYVQDEWDAAKGLKLTYGIRLDKPVFGDKPLRNPLVEASFPGYSTNRTPSTAILFSPRFGFNYDVMGDRSVQLRGGSGIFTGRVPFVWLSNQYVNNGLLFSAVNTGSTKVPFIADPNNQAAAGAGINRAEINLVSNDFKIPQVWRTNLAADFKLPYGIIGTLEGIYSKTINNVVYSDLNIVRSGTVSPALSNGADVRPAYAGRVNSTDFTNVILLDNTNKGYTYNLTAQLQKNFNNGFNAMAAYTYGKARSLNDATSSTAVSNWEFVQVVEDPNNPPLAISAYQTKHRIIASAGYNFSYGPNKAFSTGLSLFYSGYSGQPFSYVIGSGNINSDNGANNGNDLFFIPAKQADIKFNALNATATLPAQTPDQQWTALNAFIEADPYLSKHRGQYASRNGASTPWIHQVDLRVTQDLGAVLGNTKNKLQLTFDIFNVGNLLKKSWGRQYFVSNQAYSIVSYVTPNAPATPGYTFRAPSSGTPYTTGAFTSAWSGQFGVRYIFN
jgi:outer membrane receptor for ferrienterochelin and colicin